ERKILTYLLNEYKQYHHFPDIEETKGALKLNYNKQLEEKLILQFVQRGFPQVGMTPNQEKVFNYIIEQYSKYDTINTFNEIGRELNISYIDLEEIITKLEKRRVIHRTRDNDDKIVPRISKIGYDHQVILKDGRNLKPIEAACVIDALGLPFTYNQDAMILSKDPITKQEIKIEIKDEQITSQEPKNLIAYLGSQCSTTLFFISNESFKEWEKQHPDQKGTIIKIEQALTLARKIFENRLDIDYVPSSEISIDKDQKNIEWLEIPPSDKKDDCCG
ncbi:MAG: organomercurial lyase, partial [Candidatus Hermodarchaeota archaeon]